MIREHHSTFSLDQAITNNAASTNQLDLRAIRNASNGARPLYLVVQVTTAMTDSGNNSNCTVYFRTDEFAALNAATNAQTIGVFATNAAVGTRLVQIIQPANMNERYCDLYYSMGNGDLSTGAVTAFITPDPQLWTGYANNYTVSTT